MRQCRTCRQPLKRGYYHRHSAREKLDWLIFDFGEAQFACGEWTRDNEESWDEVYAQLQAAEQRMRTGLAHYAAQAYPEATRGTLVSEVA